MNLMVKDLNQKCECEMRKLIISLLSILLCIACGHVKNKSGGSVNSDINLVVKPVDPSIYTIIKFNRSENGIFKKAKPANLNTDEIIEIESLLSEFIKNYNPAQVRFFDSINKAHPEYRFNKNDFIIDLARYKRQYIPVINEKGEKEVWVNCFCDNPPNWKNEIEQVMDGGNCFFNVKINLTKKKYYDLMVNGVA
jgi:hypothetical protein